MENILSVKRDYLVIILSRLIFKHVTSEICIQIQNWETTFSCIFQDVSTITSIEPCEGLVASVEEYRCSFRNGIILLDYVRTSPEPVINILRNGPQIVFSNRMSSFCLLNTENPILSYSPPVVSLEDSVCFAFQDRELLVFVERLKILHQVSDDLHFYDDRCFAANEFGTKFEITLPLVSGTFGDHSFSCGLLIDFFDKIASSDMEDRTFDVRVYIPDMMVIVFGGLRFYIGPLLEERVPEPLQLTLNPHV